MAESKTKPLADRTEDQIVALLAACTVALADRQQDVQRGPGDAAAIRDALTGGAALRVVVEVPTARSGVLPSVELQVIDQHGGEVPLRRVTLHQALTRQVAPGRPAPEQ